MNELLSKKVLFVAKHEQAKEIYSHLVNNFKEKKIDLDYLPEKFLLKIIGVECKNKILKFVASIIFQPIINNKIKSYDSVVVCPGGFIRDIYIGLSLKHKKNVFVLQSGFQYQFQNIQNLNTKLPDKIITYRKYLFSQSNKIKYLVHGKFYKEILIKNSIEQDNIIIVGSPRIKKIKKSSDNNPNIVYLCSSYKYEKLKKEELIEKKHLQYLNKLDENQFKIIIKPHPRGQSIESLKKEFPNLKIKYFDINEISNFAGVVISNQSTANFESIFYGVPSYFVDEDSDLKFLDDRIKTNFKKLFSDYSNSIIGNKEAINKVQKEIAKKYIAYIGLDSANKIYNCL